MDSYSVPASVPADPAANATDLLIERARLTPNSALFSVPDGRGWTDITAAQFLDSVTALAKGFVDAGIEPGQKIGFMCKTRYEWTLVDFAVWFCGAILVPVYETSSPSQIEWILSDSGADAMIVENAEHFSRFDEVHGELPRIASTWQIDIGDLDKLARAGVDVSDEEIDRRRRRAQGSDVATLIYTSGSMGRPKGCVLTHSNFVELSRNSAHALSALLGPGSSTLLFITLAHVFARFIAVLAVHAGVRVGHQADTSRLLESLGSFKPTFLLAVPRVFEKVYNSAEQKAEAGGKGKIFRAAAHTAVEHSKAKVSGSVPLALRLKFALFNRLVYGQLRAAMGGKVRHAVSGSAPLGEHLGHFYHSLGIEILEGYGLTETTAPATVNLPGKAKIGTVGPPLPGVSVKIAEDGEILVRGIDVFAEYWNNPKATSEAFDDGWFHTGDIGSLDSDGYLTITGRKKELIVTAGGKNVAPAVLEDAARSNPVISQIVVVGDQKPFISALVTLDAEMLPTWLENHGESPRLSLAEAAQNPAVREEVQRAIDTANANVSRAESIRKFEILDIDFSEESGHLTPKLSIKRNVIINDFAEAIDRLYSAQDPTTGLSLK